MIFPSIVPSNAIFDPLALASLIKLFALLSWLLFIIGLSAFGSYRFAYKLFDKSYTKDKKLHIIEGASHYDLYDQPNSVNEALSGLIPFYKEKL